MEVVPKSFKTKKGVGLTGPLIMNDSDNIPDVILFFEYEPEASPIQTCVLGIEAREVIFDNDGIFVNFEAVVQ